MLKLANQNLLLSCHDISLGGIITALSKMCIRGDKGVKINSHLKLLNKFNYFFSEDQGRYIIEINKSNLNKVKKILQDNSVHFDELGIVCKDKLQFRDEIDISIKDLSKEFKSWLKNYMIK